MLVLLVYILIVSLSPGSFIKATSVSSQDIVQDTFDEGTEGRIVLFYCRWSRIEDFSQTNLSFIGHSLAFPLLFVSGDWVVFSLEEATTDTNGWNVAMNEEKYFCQLPSCPVVLVANVVVGEVWGVNSKTSSRHSPSHNCLCHANCPMSDVHHTLLLSLTWILLGWGGEEDTQSGLEVCRGAGGVGETEINTVSQHQGPRPGVQHVLGGGVDLPRDQLHVDLVLGGGAVAVRLGHHQPETSQH